MLLASSAVIVCCTIIVNAESSLNSHPFADSNGYDYSNTATNNGYLGSKDSYQNSGGFYAGGGITDNQVGGHSGLITSDTQGTIGSDTYSGYSTSGTHDSEYAGYSGTYENSNGDSYMLSTRATPASSFRGYSGNSAYKASYPSDSIYNKDSEFGNQYAASGGTSNKRIPYSAYARPTMMLESYSKGSVVDDDVQGTTYRGSSSDASSYSENDHVYSSYSHPDSLAEYSFGKQQQKDGPYGLKSSVKAYNDNVFSTMPYTETRYTRGNAAGQQHTGYDAPSSYTFGSRPASSYYLAKAPGLHVSTGKPSKYYGYNNGNKYLHARHAPNSGASYYLRDRDSYYTPYGKGGGGKVIIIKDSGRSTGYGGHVYSDEQPTSYSGYRSAGKSGGYHMTAGYSASPMTFDSDNGYDDGSALIRRYRNSGGPLLIQKKIYS